MIEMTKSMDGGGAKIENLSEFGKSRRVGQFQDQMEYSLEDPLIRHRENPVNL
jgi:hypothetical protein